MDRPAEVGNLQLALEAQQKVLWLNVAMNDMLAMTVLKRFRKLVDVLCMGSSIHRSEAFAMYMQ